MTDQRQFFTRPRLWGLLCGLTLAVAQLFTPLGGMGTAQAATLTVTSTADSGAGSLRQALANAAPGDTITFALPNPSTITLSSELVIAKNLKISGPGAAALTISGNNATRVFFINPGAAGATSGPPATALTVQISGLTIANGKAQGGAGGARGDAGGSGGSAGMGGALFSNHGNLTISGVVFDANQAQGGNSTGGGESGFGAAGGGGVGGNGSAGVVAGGAGGSGGALGGNGGGGGAAGTLLPNGSNGGNGAAGGEGAGAGGGGIGDDCPGFPSSCTGPGANGGNGGNGGFGGGAGGGGSSGDDKSGIAVGGAGGAGGFGGGGGGGGGNQSGSGPTGAGGAGGAFGGNGGSSSGSDGGSGGGGAGLGGAIFVRAGSLTLVDSSFSNNSASGGSGAQNGQGKGGALFILSPATLNVSDCINVSGNSATNAAGSAGDTNDLYGSVAQPCDTTGPVANPTLSPAPNAAGWNNTNVTVNWNWSDNLSGIVNGSCETSSTSNLGVGTQTLTAFCVDEAGNQSQASYTVKVDRAAPLIQATVNPPTSSGSWAKQALTVSFTCQEQGALSGLATNTVGGNQTFSSEGTNFTATNTGTCVDFADNVATAITVGPFKIDLTKPTISAAATTPPNANGWYNSDVTVRFTCADNLSGIVTCPADQALSSEGTAVSSTAQTVSDRALNSSDASNIVTVKIDKSAPSVTLTGVSEGASYTVGSVPTAACSTTDALSGVATQATLTITGGNGDGTGSFTATCSGATDVAGNSAAPVSVSYSVNPPADITAPDITPNVVGTLGTNDWYVSDVTVSWTVVDDESAISSQSGCETQNITSDSVGVTFTCSATSAGGTASESVTLKRDVTAPTISAAATSTPNANGWYNSNVTVQFTCDDNLSGVTSCPTDEILSSEGAAVNSTAQTVTDLAGNSSAASNVVTVQIDKTAPAVTVTGVSAGGNYTLGSVPTAACSTTDALSGVATQATLTITGGNADGTGNFTATCSGAIDLAGNSAAAVSVSYTVAALVDVCTTTALRDDFNRANGGLGSNWAGLTGQSFYKLANNKVDVQLGGPVVWKPTTFGVNQAAFVTLNTLDANSPSQGVLLKVQSGSIPNAGAISVVYDSVAKAVRVATLRLNTFAWTTYGNTPATFANGDKLLGCVQADGTVRVYQNNSLLTTVTLNTTDQSFFNGKGGKIGLWTVVAFNATFDDFGGGALTGVTGAALSESAVPDEVADDGAEITVAENFPTDDTAVTPDAGTLANRVFLPLVNR